MYFNYAGYELECFQLPIFPLIIVFCSLPYETISFIKKIKYKNLNWKGVAKYVGFLIFDFFFIFMLCGQLLHGGIYLFLEQETDAVKTQGYISEIRELGVFSFPRMESDYGYGESNGVEFVIDDICCTAPLRGTLEIGDYVEVEYLPRSGYILYIGKIENE